jgi:hypothetical protein
MLEGYEVKKEYAEIDTSKLMTLNRDNYFSQEANKIFMSVSQYKSFREEYGGCEAKAVAELKGEWEDKEKTAFIEGHYIHAWQSNELDEFKAENPDLYASTGKNKGELKTNFKHCNKMIETLERDEFVMRVLSGEKEVIMTASLFGVPWKITIDSYRPAMKSFADLKGIREIGGKFWRKQEDGGYWENFLQHYGYDLQMAVYAEVERIEKGREPEDWFIPHIVVVDKSEEPDHEVIYFDSEMIRAKLFELEANLPRVIAVKNGEVEPQMCGVCNYCKSKKRLTRAKFYREFDLY